MDNVCVSVQYNGEYLALIFVVIFRRANRIYIALYICGLFKIDHLYQSEFCAFFFFLYLTPSDCIHAFMSMTKNKLLLCIYILPQCFYIFLTVMCLPVSFLNKE